MTNWQKVKPIKCKTSFVVADFNLVDTKTWIDLFNKIFPMCVEKQINLQKLNHCATFWHKNQMKPKEPLTCSLVDDESLPNELLTWQMYDPESCFVTFFKDKIEKSSVTSIFLRWFSLKGKLSLSQWNVKGLLPDATLQTILLLSFSNNS